MLWNHTNNRTILLNIYLDCLNSVDAQSELILKITMVRFKNKWEIEIHNKKSIQKALIGENCFKF